MRNGRAQYPKLEEGLPQEVGEYRVKEDKKNFCQNFNDRILNCVSLSAGVAIGYLR